MIFARAISVRFAILLIALLVFSWLPTPNLQASGSGVVINEIMYDFPGSDTNHEWIEIWNTSATSVDLTDWKLFENNINHTLNVFQGSSVLNDQSFAVLTGSGSVFLGDHPGFGGTIIDTTFSLHNTGETISLKDSVGSTVDSLTYASSSGGAGNGKTLERDNTGSFLESLVSGGTPGEVNSVYSVATNGNQNENNTNQNGFNTNGNMSDGNVNQNSPPQNSNANSSNENQNAPVGNTNTNSVSGGGGSGGGTNQNTNAPVTFMPGDILINEVFVHPATGDSEWIELYNTTNSTIDLSYWTITDNNNNPDNLNGSIAAQSYFVLEPSPVGLNNTGGDTVVIKAPDGQVIDQIQYGNFNDNGNNAPLPQSQQTLARIPNLQDTNNDKLDFRSFGNPTKGSENISNNHPPTAVITVQYPYKTSGTAPFSLNVTGENSSDPDGDSLSFLWNYGDGTILTVENPLSHKFLVAGNYTVSLTVTDPWGETATTSVNIFVAESTSSGTTSKSTTVEPVHCSSQETSAVVRLSEILPNPVGKDAENEFIEIENIGDAPVNLCGWQLDDVADAGSKPYTIGEVVIEPHQFISFPAPVTKIALNNDEDMARLLDPFGAVIDQIAYDHPPEGKSYARVKKKLSYAPFTKEEVNTLPLPRGSWPATSWRSHRWRGSRLLASLDLTVGVAEETQGKNDATVWDWTTPTPGEPNDFTVTFQGVIINELLPNPDGTDAEGEFIELKNISPTAIYLKNWKLRDASKKTFTLHDDIVIEPNGFLLLPRSTTNISLNNDTDSLTLLDDTGNLQDNVTYEKSEMGKSYSRFVNNPAYPQDSDWEWTVPTPNAENIRASLVATAKPTGKKLKEPTLITLTANKPDAKIFYSFSGTTVPEEFAAYTEPILITHSTDLWFFAVAPDQEHSPIYTEHYTLLATALTGSGALLINEVFPNPTGKDSEKEWIELVNRGEESANLSGYFLLNRYNKKLLITENTILAPSQFLVLHIPISDFRLTNTTETLRLYTPQDELVDEISYAETKSAASWIRLVGAIPDEPLVLTTTATPGQENILTVKAVKKKKAKITKPKTTTAEATTTGLAELLAPTTAYAAAGGVFPESSAHSDISTILSGITLKTYFLVGTVIFVLLLTGTIFLYRKKE